MLKHLASAIRLVRIHRCHAGAFRRASDRTSVSVRNHENIHAIVASAFRITLHQSPILVWSIYSEVATYSPPSLARFD